MPYCEIRPGRIRLEDETTGSVRYIVQKDDNLEYLDANQNRIQRLSNIVFGNEADLPSAGIKGRIYVATDTKKVFFDDGTNWTEISGAAPTVAFHGCRAKLTADQSISGGSTAVVQFDTEVYDTDNEYDPSNYTFTAASTGYYEFYVTLNVYNSNSSNVGWQLILNVNGTDTVHARGKVFASSSWNHIDMQVIRKLTSGDTVQVKCYAEQTFTLKPYGEECYLEVKYLGS